MRSNWSYMDPELVSPQLTLLSRSRQQTMENQENPVKLKQCGEFGAEAAAPFP
jgi:hypothetical protein